MRYEEVRATLESIGFRCVMEGDGIQVPYRRSSGTDGMWGALSEIWECPFCTVEVIYHTHCGAEGLEARLKHNAQQVALAMQHAGVMKALMVCP